MLIKSKIHRKRNLIAIVNIFSDEDLQTKKWNNAPFNMEYIHSTSQIIRITKTTQKKISLVRILKYAGHDLALLTLGSTVDVTKPRSKPIRLPLTFNPGIVNNIIFYSKLALNNLKIAETLYFVHVGPNILHICP